VSIERTISEDMIIMQSLDLAIKACVCIKKMFVYVCLTVACYELNSSNNKEMDSNSLFMNNMCLG